MKLYLSVLVLLLIVLSCKKDDVNTPATENPDFISAADLSSYPQIATSNSIFFNRQGVKSDFLSIISEQGINTIRLRLWVNPENNHSGLAEVKQFAETLKNKGFNIWLSLHYSDTWADPAHQIVPQNWQNAHFAALKDSVALYTKKIVNEINPDFIQIGNEINTGFLHPYGDIVANYRQFTELMKTATSAVRTNSAKAKIIIHFAGIENAAWFFEKINGLDYDIIGVSFYPVWHGKSLANLENTLLSLSKTYKKQIVIAETAYPFTLEWNDWTNNIVGQQEQLILPDYPASIQGQRDFIRTIRKTIAEIPDGIGFCYWGGELIAWKGNQATNGSPWENQALFDFENKALPVLEEFGKQ